MGYPESNELMSKAQMDALIAVINGEEAPDAMYPATNELPSKEQGNELVEAVHDFIERIPGGSGVEIPEPTVGDIGKVLGVVEDGTGAKYSTVESGSDYEHMTVVIDYDSETEEYSSVIKNQAGEEMTFEQVWDVLSNETGGFSKAEIKHSENTYDEGNFTSNISFHLFEGTEEENSYIYIAARIEDILFGRVYSIYVCYIYNDANENDTYCDGVYNAQSSYVISIYENQGVLSPVTIKKAYGNDGTFSKCKIEELFGVTHSGEIYHTCIYALHNNVDVTYNVTVFEPWDESAFSYIKDIIIGFNRFDPSNNKVVTDYYVLHDLSDIMDETEIPVANITKITGT